MTYLNKTFGARATAQETGSGSGQSGRATLVLLVEDDLALSDIFRSVCECLNVAVERVPTRSDLGSILRQRRPMAVVAEMDAAGQDGCNVLMTVAAYDRDLPVMLIAADDPALLGAIDAVEEIWQLSSVDKWPQRPNIGTVVDFIFRAGRKGGCMRLMST